MYLHCENHDNLFLLILNLFLFSFFIYRKRITTVLLISRAILHLGNYLERIFEWLKNWFEKWSKLGSIWCALVIEETWHAVDVYRLDYFTYRLRTNGLIKWEVLTAKSKIDSAGALSLNGVKFSFVMAELLSPSL